MLRARGHVVLLSAFVACGCAPSRRPPPPAVDFLLAAGDSTYWVTADSTALRMRGEPIILARYGGRFHEVYVADDDHSYQDALLVGQLVFSRDLITNDSTVVFVDTLVTRVARAYARAHPNDAPLEPDDPVSDRPAVTATSDVTLLDVHGPYLSLEYHADTRQRPEPGYHTTWRAVVDMRTGNPVRLENLIGVAAAARVVDRERQAYAVLLDSARSSARGLPDIVSSVLSEVRFDPTSFTLTQWRGAPAVAFAGRVSGEHDAPTALSLTPLAIDSQAWWGDVRSTLPSPRSAGVEQWVRPGYTVRASADTGDSVVDVTVVDSTRRTWSVGQVHVPLRHIFWLDRPRVDSITRRALQHAFDQASLYDEDARVATLRVPRQGGPRVHAAAAATVHPTPLRPAVRRPLRRRAASP
jgi:hypothetical protein